MAIIGWAAGIAGVAGSRGDRRSAFPPGLPIGAHHQPAFPPVSAGKLLSPAFAPVSAGTGGSAVTGSDQGVPAYPPLRASTGTSAGTVRIGIFAGEDVIIGILAGEVLLELPAFPP